MIQLFEGHIAGDAPVIVEFFADWNGPSAWMEPVLHELRDEMGERATVLRIDIGKHPDFVSRFDIRTVPTLMIFRHGQVLWRKNGMATRQEILGQLYTCLG